MPCEWLKGYILKYTQLFLYHELILHQLTHCLRLIAMTTTLVISMKSLRYDSLEIQDAYIVPILSYL